MIKLKTAAAIALVVTVVGGKMANAQTIPRFDVEGYCNQVSEVVGGSHQIYNSCVQSEQRSYNVLNSSNSNISSRILRYCTDVAEAVGGSYQIMQSCVEMEKRAAGNSESFSFD